MPVPNRTRNKNGQFRKKRSDVGIKRGYSMVTITGTYEQVNNTVDEFKKAGIEYIELEDECDSGGNLTETTDLHL